MNEITSGLLNYWVAVFLMMAGFYVVIAQGNLVKKVVGLGLFQTSVFILYISMGKVEGGTEMARNPVAPVYPRRVTGKARDRVRFISIAAPWISWFSAALAVR